MGLRTMLGAAATAAVAAACSLPDNPRALPTVLITNATCDSGACRTLAIRAFVSKFTVPGQLPIGMEALEEVPPGRTCLTFPRAWNLRIIGDTIVDDTINRVDTVTITWTPEDGTPVYLIAMDSASMAGPTTQARLDSSRHRVWPYDGFFPGSVGETPSFVPNHAAGWTATFPGPAGGAQLVPGEPCKP